MNRLSIEPFFDYIQTWLKEHRIEDAPEGTYVRQTLGESFNKLDAYSCSDVADICYTFGILPYDSKLRDEWVGVIQSLQDPQTGLFTDPTHHPDHTTAYAISALELFDARPLHSLTAYNDLKSKQGLEDFLDSQDWKDNPWGTGHRGAGVASSFAITHEVDKKWFDNYFVWLDREHDPDTGFLRKGVRNARVQSEHTDDVAFILPALGGTFHFHFVYHHFHYPWPYPEAVIDNTLKLQLDAGTFAESHYFGFPDLDAVFELGRSVRICGHRFGEVMAALEKLARRVVPWVNDPDWREQHRERLDDTHLMAGVVFCLAELQTLVPGLVDSPLPMKNVLDRRPFL